MASDMSTLPSPNPEHRRAAAGQFDRANQVIATGNHDYGIQLLLSCCTLDPGNLIYRKALRKAQKAKHNNNKRGSWLAWLTNAWPKAKIKKAMRDLDWLYVLELGETALTRNPWDIRLQMDMAEAADQLNLPEVAIWFLESARKRAPNHIGVNRHLARIYEEEGHFAQAITLWEHLRKINPGDQEAISKAKDLAASETIARGQYEQVARNKPSSRRASHSTKRGNSSASQSKVEASDVDLDLEDDEPSEPVSGILRSGGGEQELKSSIEKEPTVANHYLQLATFYRRTGRVEEATELLKQGLSATGNDFDISMELANLEVEPFRQNLSLTEERLKANADDEELTKIRIRLLKEINTRELDICRQKADRFPNELSHRFELGLRLLRAGQVDEAIKELQLARSEKRFYWKSTFYLGHCFRGRNNWRLAKKNYEEALENLPQNEVDARKEILFQLANGAAQQGEFAEAVEKGYELADLEFSYKNIGQLLDEWQSKLKQ